MVTQTGLSPLGNLNPLSPLGGNMGNMNIPGTGSLGLANYADDIMMSGLNFNLQNNLQPTAQTGGQTTASVQTPLPLNQTAQQTTTQATNTQQSFTSNTEQLPSELDGLLVQQDKGVACTENGNTYKKSTLGKLVGGIAGFFTPLASKIVDLMKGGNISELFKFKQLAIVCPALALAGFGIGALVDGFINSKKAKAADEKALAKAQAETIVQNNQPQQIKEQTINTIA
ncbi:MAG: hypothetical protein ACI37Q_01820 [Candidatus Gastranaerophilaceae bacterium]